MQTVRIFFLFLFICRLSSFAQTWDPDAVSNLYVKQIKQGSRYGLVRFTSDNKTDTIPAIYDYVCLYEGYQQPGYLGHKDSAWYKLDFDSAPFRIPAQKYLGFDFFLLKKGRTFSVYSLNEGRNVLENMVQCNTTMEEILPEEGQRSDELSPFKPVYNDMINDELWLRDAGGTMYWLSNYGGLYIKNIKVTERKTAGKTLYGISYISSDAKAKQVAQVYDKVELYSRTYALKGTTYDIYNSLINKIGESEEILFMEGSDLVPVKKKGRYGLVSPYGKEILPAVFDTLYFQKLIIAHKKDSVFFYESGRLVTALSPDASQSGAATFSVKGNYDLLPLYVYAVSGTTEKCVFLYNAYDRSVLNMSAYTDVFFYGISGNRYLLAARKDGKYGLIDLKGKVISPFEYEYLGRSLFDGYGNDTVQAHVAVRNGKTGFIGRDLQTLVPFEYDGISGMDMNERLMYSYFGLKKGKQWHLFRYADKFISPYGYDTLLLNTAHSTSIGWHKNKPDIAVKNGQKFHIDSTGKAWFDFSKISVTEQGKYVVLEETALNERPVNIAPLATINRVEDLNTEHHYAIVFCLNRYFIVNQYGEMSSGYEGYPEYYDHEHGLTFVKKLKSQQSPALYDFKGRELGQMSKGKNAYMEYDMKTREAYYFFFDSSGKKRGLMNAKGDLLLECRYMDIGTISEGKCEVWEKKETGSYTVDLKSLKPITRK